MSPFLLICLGVNYLKTEIKYDYLTDWHEVFIEDIMGEVFAERKTERATLHIAPGRCFLIDRRVR